ncbi:hypothetical protein ACONUD_08745 [Microbulbifer harenosus]|uniref:hypothetical protein n=1 Tax=Microbulbifer harenosus TaxID=2576840 RepID=UPI001485975C|nr:hypothetical protein [Microbulbifer harenosus]
MLQTAYGNEIDFFGGITFLTGPWYAQGSEYGYHINDGVLYIAHATEDGHDKHIVKISDCREIEEGIKEVERAIFETSEIAAGIKKTSVSDIIIMDGPSYRLEYYSPKISGSIIFEGDANSIFVSPWVNAALKIGDIADACE